ncbi:MAG: biotin--[acetyl-CoA-carboxylase] ligase [Clostridium sp.]|nr:biotin--[acetyl-CoA-carboxylase] ligase [Clostridium sp.]MCM1460260.1 biotin--[acetyl-CoA-carboxylase] ligase [Bacteroides sp.]
MTKDKVLAILKQNDDYVSGEKISSVLGVSRMAVSSAVKSLRNDGYNIISVTNKGYLLQENPQIDKLTIGELMAYLPEERLERVLCLDTVSSTNTKLRELAFDNAPSGYVVIANQQTSGRGRRGRSFVSPKDTGIYMSILLRPDCLPHECPTITAWTAVSVCNAIERVTGISPSIKWVNDLLLNNKKICGILSELSVESEGGHVQHIIVGIGINTNEASEDFPDDIKDIATSIYAETGKKTTRAQLVAEVINELDKMMEHWPKERDQYLEQYRKLNITTGREIQVLSANAGKNAKALEINEDFSLKVMYEDGTIADIASGEVSTRLAN